MSVIPATSGTYRSRVDGTLVVSIEIEPRHRDDALKLFGQPGTSLAIAALKVGHEAKSDKEVGYTCLRAVQLCQNPKFWEWIRLASLQGKAPKSETEAAAVVREVCGIESRNELDDDLEARAIFGKRLEQPFVQWLAKQGQPA